MAAASAFSPAATFKGLAPLPLADGKAERERKRRRGAGGGGGGQPVCFQGSQRGGLCPTVSCGVCCCFAEGLWEVLALGGQLATPPSSCFDRHPALIQTFSLFHFICEPPYGHSTVCETGVGFMRQRRPIPISLFSVGMFT